MTPEHITLADYLGPYRNHDDVTLEVENNAQALLDRVNVLIDRMDLDGVPIIENPITRSLVSGTQNGGFRPQACPIGAARSKHKTGNGVDVYDPQRALATWAVNNLDVLQELGLYIEDPRWTPTWLHLQDLPPGNPPNPARTVFIPDASRPKAAALPGQVVA